MVFTNQIFFSTRFPFLSLHTRLTSGLEPIWEQADCQYNFYRVSPRIDSGVNRIQLSNMRPFILFKFPYPTLKRFYLQSHLYYPYDLPSYFLYLQYLPIYVYVLYLSMYATLICVKVSKCTAQIKGIDILSSV